jgi:choline dehydrogenase
MHSLVSSMFLSLREFIKYMLTGRGLFLLPNPQIAIFCRSALLDEDLQNVVQHTSQTIPVIRTTYLTSKSCLFRMTLLSRCVIYKERVPSRYSASFCIPSQAELCALRPRMPESVQSVTSVKEDYAAMRKVIRLSLRIGRQMREQGYPLRDLDVPQSESDTDVDDFIYHAARTTYHYSSSCRMAPEDDQMPGVVDDELKVYGVRGLKVGDASVFPLIPAAHLQAPAVMVAEKCADFLRAELTTR